MAAETLGHLVSGCSAHLLVMRGSWYRADLRPVKGNSSSSRQPGNPGTRLRHAGGILNNRS